MIFGALRDLLVEPWICLSILEQAVLIGLARLCEALGAGQLYQLLVAPLLITQLPAEQATLIGPPS
jgi:hypothetical protein